MRRRKERRYGYISSFSHNTSNIFTSNYYFTLTTIHILSYIIFDTNKVLVDIPNLLHRARGIQLEKGDFLWIKHINMNLGIK